MQFNGKLVTILLVGIALAMASYAWWFQFSRGQRALAYWQGANAAVIRHGEAADLLVLQSPDDAGNDEAVPTLSIDGREYRVTKRVTLDQAPGFVHARHALIDDGSYQWEKEPQGELTWSHALVFENKAKQRVTVVIALPGGFLRTQQGERPLAMSKILQSGLGTFFQEQLEPEADPSVTGVRDKDS
jgi:hypothetical protein